MSASENDILEKISNLQNDYYTRKPKNIFLKNTSKIDCATVVSQNINIDEMIRKTVFIIPETNIVYFDYCNFKLFANPNIYTKIVDYILQLFISCIDKYGSFEAHLNLKTFSVSAAQRYKSIIEIFCSKCLQNNTQISLKLDKFFIYNIPSIFDSIAAIFSVFIDNNVRNKIIICTKEQSSMILESLLISLEENIKS